MRLSSVGWSRDKRSSSKRCCDRTVEISSYIAAAGFLLRVHVVPSSGLPLIEVESITYPLRLIATTSWLLRSAMEECDVWTRVEPIKKRLQFLRVFLIPTSNNTTAFLWTYFVLLSRDIQLKKSTKSVHQHVIRVFSKTIITSKREEFTNSLLNDTGCNVLMFRGKNSIQEAK